ATSRALGERPRVLVAHARAVDPRRDPGQFPVAVMRHAQQQREGSGLDQQGIGPDRSGDFRGKIDARRKCPGAVRRGEQREPLQRQPARGRRQGHGRSMGSFGGVHDDADCTRRHDRLRRGAGPWRAVPALAQALPVDLRDARGDAADT
ncbi:MAG: hypothetical protein ACK559_32110, partial [bacterium]